MNIFQVILLGILQGVTEFLPVSSSGHTAIVQQLFNIDVQGGIFLSVLLHVGTLAGVFAVFSRDLRRMAFDAVGILRDFCDNLRILSGNRKGKSNEAYKRLIDSNYRKFFVLIVVSSIPTALLGFFSRHMVDAAAQNALAPGIGLLITGIFLLVTDFAVIGKKIPMDTTYANAMWIGICQGMAVLPGVSRLGVTLAACLLSGFGRKYAVKYSFIMSVPAILGALILELSKMGSLGITWSVAGMYLLGALAAAVVGFFTAGFFVRFFQKKKLKVFALYCFFIGLGAIIGNFAIL